MKKFRFTYEYNGEQKHEDRFVGCKQDLTNTIEGLAESGKRVTQVEILGAKRGKK